MDKQQRQITDLKSRTQGDSDKNVGSSFASESGGWGEALPGGLDPLAISQYLDTVGGPRELQPEKKLMLAVLENAIDCFRKNLFSAEEQKRTLFQDAEQWILQEGDSYLFSFDSVCEAFDIDPRYLRKRLMAYKHDKQRQRAA